MPDPVTPAAPTAPAVPAALAVPPTPAVPLSALLAREDLGLRRIAGPDDPGVAIHWAHTSEMADPYPYLLGGELLLTAGVHVPGAARGHVPGAAGGHVPEAAGGDGGAAGSGAGGGLAEYFDGYVARIVAAGGAALGFGVAPVHDTVPRALVEACERHGLPLLEVPPQTTFSGVARAVWQLMAQARLAELRRVTEAQQSLAAAASRPDPVPSVLRQLARRLGGRAVLYGPEGTEIAAAGRPADERTRRALAELTRVVRPLPGRSRTPEAASPATTPGSPAETPPGTGPDGPRRPAPVPAPTPASATDTVAGRHLAAYSLGAGQGFVLGVVAPQREAGDHTIASVAAVLLSLLTGEHQSGTGAARSSALVRLLLGARPEDVAPLLGEGEGEGAGEGGGDGPGHSHEGGAVSGRWRVVHARPATAAAPDAVAASALGAALGSPLVDLGRDAVRVVLPPGPEPRPQPGWTLGVSGAVGPHDLPAADTQAARALGRARATRTALARHGDRAGLAALVPPDEAEAHARALLAPIATTPALTETLRTWLSLHGSWDRTAVALSVHRNTVRQRVARCATLLAADLDDPDVRMELWFALRQV
ncbi:PucR family transcriptional regulator [Streptomyces sp. DH24]|uniref:PucR family transcriptional regulator n=1 Tax=Streptomyces sp. DH24 TaxID=3040123 RepID=UPI002442EA01|nr:PucR family transcriptional regulator [Streptomyces sp. DH24]MDG9716713.1 helix-turn-helix domain-containing protein [Streptomyces sp. DH24]